MDFVILLGLYLRQVSAKSENLFVPFSPIYKRNHLIKISEGKSSVNLSDIEKLKIHF